MIRWFLNAYFPKPNRWRVVVLSDELGEWEIGIYKTSGAAKVAMIDAVMDHPTAEHVTATEERVRW